jgi:ubiquinone/menaquinone biosynthesis C-methylase UbiE
MKKLEYISRETIRDEWNIFAPYRHNQIISGKDISYDHVLVPIIQRMIKNKKQNEIIDIGCGSGELTKNLSNNCDHIIGIDPSRKSIQIAKEYCKDRNNISFEETFAEDYNCLGYFDLAVANMVLMDSLNINGIFRSIYNMLTNDGALVFTITHPCFWPIYWGYFNKKWFNYYSEIPIKTEFKITNEQTSYKTTHIHRPLNTYLKEISKAGFYIEEIREPYPDWNNIEQTNGYSYSYPRFIGISCVKKKS